jgi:hypothetical protein
MRLEHALDPGRADPTLEALDDALALHEGKGRHGLYAEVFRQLGLFVDVDLPHLKALALRARDVRDEALHSPRGAGVGGAEEDEQRQGVTVHDRCLSPAKRLLNREPRDGVYTPDAMWEWYRIGLSLGLGIGIGGLCSALAAPRRTLVALVAVVAAAIGAAIGYAIGGWHEAVAGGIGGALGAAAVAPLVVGALRRGGTRGGTAVLVGLASLLLAALALIPVVGFLEAVGLPAFGARARRREGERYAGLRSLARD